MSLNLAAHQGTKIITGVCASALALTACQTDTAPEHTVTSEYIRFTDQPQPSENDIPDAVLDEPVLSNIEDHYFRYLGVHSSTEFYMARTDHDDTVAQGLCFIAVDTKADEATSECKAPDELDPMVLQLDTPVEAFLIPDHADLELPEGWSQVRTNVVVVTDPDIAPEEADMRLTNNRDFWETFTLQRN